MKKSILMLMVLIFSFIQASFAQVSTWNFEVKDRHSSGKFSYNIPMAIVAVANTDINYSQAFYLPATTDTYIFMRAVASEVGTEDINLFWQFASDPSVVTASWITEATDGSELFRMQRLEIVARQNAGQSARQMLEAIVRRVEEFTGDRPQSDDMTVVVLRRV